MSPKSFFMIVVRIVGIFLFMNVLTGLPMTISLLSTVGVYREGFAITPLIVFIILMAIFLSLIVYYLLIKPEKLIEYFDLDKRFEEEKFELNFSRTVILKISIIIIGGITLFNQVPKFLQELFVFWRQKNILWQEDPETSNLIFSIVIIVSSYFLIYYNEKIVQYIEKKSEDLKGEENGNSNNPK